MEPHNKGHLCTEGIVPYSEVVPYWEVSQKKLNIDVKSPLKNRDNYYQQCTVLVKAILNIMLFACAL